MRRAIVLGSVSGLNVLVGFASQWYIFTELGPGRETDAYFAGMVIPTLVLAVVSGSLMHVLVPLLSTTDAEQFRREAWTFFQIIGLAFAGLAAPLALAAPYWVPLTVPGFDAPAVDLTVYIVRVQLLGMVFTAATGVLWAAYRARKKFLWAEASPVLATVLTFPFLIWALPRLGVVAAAWTLVGKLALQMAFLLPGLGAYRRPGFQTPSVTEAWRRIRPLLAGTTFYKTGHFVDRFLASLALPGQLSLLHLSSQLYSAGQSVLNSSVATPMVPELAQLARRGRWSEFRQVSRRRLQQMLALTSVALIGIALVGLPVLTLLFGHGRFDPAEIRQLWILLLALGGVWIGGCSGQILAPSFYAKGDTVTPTRVGVAGYVVGIFLKVGGFLWLGVVGIALGSSLYILMNAAVMFFLLRRHLSRHVAHTEDGSQPVLTNA